MRKNIYGGIGTLALLLTLLVGWPTTSHAQIPTAQWCAQRKAFDLSAAQKLRDDTLRTARDAWTKVKIQDRYNIQVQGIQNLYDKCMVEVGLYNNKPVLSDWPPRTKMGGNTTRRTGKQTPR